MKVKNPEELVEITVRYNDIKYYESLGYLIPRYPKKARTNKDGSVSYIKNKDGSIFFTPGPRPKIKVKTKDLLPLTMTKVPAICPNCGKEKMARIIDITKSNTCKECYFKENRNETSFKNLIDNNPEAKCDISGETNKLFLCVHHLTSRQIGGENTLENVVILTYNHHYGFHKWLGGTSVPASPEKYYEYKNSFI